MRPAEAVVQIPAPPDARVVKWQTRTFEGRMPQGVGVQVPPRAERDPRRPAATQSRFEFVADSGSIYEVSRLCVGPWSAFLVEINGRSGTISGNGQCLVLASRRECSALVRSGYRWVRKAKSASAGWLIPVRVMSSFYGCADSHRSHWYGIAGERVVHRPSGP